jgi:hypothetical protein
MPKRSVALGCALVGLALLSVACASTGGLRTEPLDAGVGREFSGDYAAVLRAAEQAVLGAGLTVDSYEEVNDSTAVIVGKKGMSAWSWGELVRVVVQKSAADRVAVRVFTRRKMATNVTAKGDYSETIFANIELALR